MGDTRDPSEPTLPPPSPPPPGDPAATPSSGLAFTPLLPEARRLFLRGAAPPDTDHPPRTLCPPDPFLLLLLLVVACCSPPLPFTTACLGGGEGRGDDWGEGRGERAWRGVLVAKGGSLPRPPGKSGPVEGGDTRRTCGGAECPCHVG